MLTYLDASSRQLAEKREEAVADFIDLADWEIESKLKAGLNLVPNDWQAVEACLEGK